MLEKIKFIGYLREAISAAIMTASVITHSPSMIRGEVGEQTIPHIICIAICNIEITTEGLTNPLKQTHGCYQTHYLPCLVVEN